MISCWLEGGTQFWLCAAAAREIAKKSFHIRILEVEPHRSGDQPRLTQMPQITAGTLPRDTAGAQRRPVVYIARVIRGDAPGGHFPKELRSVAGAKINYVVLRRVGAV